MASPPRPYNSSNVAAAVELVRSGSGNTLADMIAFQGLAEETGIGNGRGKRQLYPVFEASEDMADEDVMDDTLHPVEKKRRLSIEQVKSLEKNFEIENKLEPERKLQLAKELGLQPRQVAVWFQNRRARWKTKQLEKDYDVLKSEFDTLKMNYEVLIQEKEKLEAEVLRLTDKLKTDDESTEEPCAKENEPRETVVPFAKLDAVKIEEANEVGLPQIGEERSADNEVLSKPQKEASLCSDSEVSEIMEAESGSSTAEDDQCFQLAGPLTDPATLAFVSEDPYCRVLLPVAYQRPVVKLEEGSLHEENYHMSFIFEDQGNLSFWDWP